MNKIYQFIKEPYPFLHKGRNLWRVTGLILVIGFLFEYLLVPFERNPSEHLHAFWIISLAHVGTAAVVYTAYFLILAHLIDHDDWSLGKEIGALLVLLFFIGVGEWLIRDLIYNSPYNWDFRIFVEEVWHAYLSGGVIIFLVISIGFRTSLRQNTSQAAKLDLTMNSTQEEMRVPMKANIQADDFELALNQLVCIRADGNYLEFYLSNSEVLLKRMSLQSALDQLKDVGPILKTHRAFCVNKTCIRKVKGNAAGYKLRMEGLDFEIPVSRSHIDGFNAAMKGT